MCLRRLTENPSYPTDRTRSRILPLYHRQAKWWNPTVFHQASSRIDQNLELLNGRKSGTFRWRLTVDDIQAGFTSGLDELCLEFGDVATEFAEVLFERKTIPQSDCEALCRQLDVQFSMAGRPSKSDIVCRLITKQFEWKSAQRNSGGVEF